MKSIPLLLALTVAIPASAVGQHSHGGKMPTPSPQRPQREKPAPPDGILPPGSPRGIEVLVFDRRFSPTQIQAEVGEDIVLLVRRSSAGSCGGGLEIPARQVEVALPLDVTVPVPLHLEQEETLEVRCAGDEPRAVIVVSGAGK